MFNSALEGILSWEFKILTTFSRFEQGIHGVQQRPRSSFDPKLRQKRNGQIHQLVRRRVNFLRDEIFINISKDKASSSPSPKPKYNLLETLTESKQKNLDDKKLTIKTRAKQDYLEGEPKGLDSSLKAHEHVKKVLASWGK